MIKKTVNFVVFFLLMITIQSVNAQVNVSGAHASSNGTYTNLRLAFAAINAQSQTGNDIEITLTSEGTITDDNTATLNAGEWNRIYIYPTVAGVVLSATVDAPMIKLDGADNVTIDGRANMMGSTKSLMIVNSSSSSLNHTSTIYLTNGATYNTIKYCTIGGDAGNIYSGVVFFSESTESTGNNYNVIENNNLTNSSDLVRPANIIYSQGTTGKENSENIISNNNIYNFLNRWQFSCGILLFQMNTGWIITGNSFYDETDIVPTQNIITHEAIKINDGDNYLISENFIGGKSAFCGGGAMTKTADKNNSFTGISINGGSGLASSIQNNTIKNIQWSNSGDATWTGIAILGGNVNVGTVSGNKIGATTGTGSITVTGGLDMDVYCINIESSGTVNVHNNIIGSITAANSSSTNASNIYAINKSASGGNISISSNIIGSVSTANSIQSTSASTGSGQSVRAIVCMGTDNNTISNNTIANLTNYSTGSTGLAYMRGIVSIKGTNSISNNTIYNLTSASLNLSAIYGIIVYESTVSNLISNNTIYNLIHTNAAYEGDIVGIYDGHTTTSATSVISENFLHSFSVNAATTTARILGIVHQKNNSTYSNNIISLGGNTRTTLYGIYDSGNVGETLNLYHNTIYLSGSLSSGSTSKSYCVFSANKKTPPKCQIRRM